MVITPSTCARGKAIIGLSIICLSVFCHHKSHVPESPYLGIRVTRTYSKIFKISKGHGFIYDLNWLVRPTNITNRPTVFYWPQLSTSDDILSAHDHVHQSMTMSQCVGTMTRWFTWHILYISRYRSVHHTILSIDPPCKSKKQILYSGKLSREKTFTRATCEIFLREILGVLYLPMLVFSIPQNFYLWNGRSHLSAKVFSLENFSLYGN